MKPGLKLHITHDDKFIDAFIRRTQNLGYNNHEFYIYSQSNENSLKHVTDPSIKRISIKELNEGKINIEKYETVYIHYFADELIDFIQKNGYKSKFVWIFWGADAFDMSLFRKDYWATETANIMANTNEKRKTLKAALSNARRKWFEIRKERKKIKASSQFNYFAHYLSDDIELIKHKFHCQFRQINFTYGSTTDFVSKNNQLINKPNILIGNSANAANNHTDALLSLKKCEIQNDVTIYCPLSYSGSPEYVAEIKKNGELLFKKQFKAIEGFLPRTEYDTIISTIGYAIMPHYRSQAFGNIINLLWQGTKLYFFERNNLYKLLKKKGFYIYTIENGIDIIPLTSSEIQVNKSLLNVFLGESKTNSNYKALLNS